MTDKREWRKRARYWRQQARIEKADRKRLREDIRVLRRSAVVQHWQSKKLLDQINALSEREAAALNTAEATRQQVLQHAATIAELRERLVALQESDMLDLLEKKRLLAWQRRVREAWAHYKKAHLSEQWTAPVDDLRRAIESEPKEET